MTDVFKATSESWKMPKGKIIAFLLILQKRRENLIFHALEISPYWELYAFIFVFYVVFRQKPLVLPN